MTRIGADLIAEGLAAYGVEHVFAIVSIHNMPILDAINRLGKTRIIDVRHEQAAAMMAHAYTRLRNRPGAKPSATAAASASRVPEPHMGS